MNHHITVKQQLVFEDVRNSKVVTRHRLRRTQATVISSDRYDILEVDFTVLAFIDRKTDTLYDIMRMHGGFTVYKAGLIEKFDMDYGKSIYGTANTYTYR